MRRLWVYTALAALCLAPALHADEGKKEAKTYQVPYRLTNFNHVMVRAKINGKGPFNFIVDTGAPALFVATAVAEKIGVEPDKTGWGTFDKFELEGGLVIEKARGRIETPFQLEGMNGLGLAGAELHGMIGYNLLAKFRLEFDFTKNKMGWTPLDFDPPAPKGLSEKPNMGGLDMMGQFMKMAGSFLGTKANPDLAPRAFLGVEIAEEKKADGSVKVVVKSVLSTGPAGKAGFQVGDVITEFTDRTVRSADDVTRYLSKRQAGDKITVTVERAGKEQELSFKAGEGL
jgi:serine protease DegQ